MPTAPIIYNYSGLTGRYLGTAYADPDPMDETNWLIPANATQDPPQDPPAGYVMVRIDHDRWEALEDLRGTVYSTLTGEAMQHDAFGPLPTGYTTVAPPGPYYTWQAGAWQLDKTAQREGLTAAAIQQRDTLQSDATARIAPLQDAVVLGEATPAEAAALLDWKRYRVQLNRIEQQAGYPHTIDWPQPPR